MTLLEVCVDTVEGALAAQRGGAGRIELCADLVVGGTTPSLGLFHEVRSRVTLPVFAMVRTRAGDFVYRASELAVMRRDAVLLREAGADGLVLGALTPDGDVDHATTAELVELARPLPVTFHRAFDHVRDASAALEVLVELGVERVLTSGQRPTAPEGAERLRELVQQAGDRILVMPGGGIREEHLPELVRRTGAREVHASARSRRPSAGRHASASVPIGYAGDDGIAFTDEARVRSFVRSLG